MLQLRLVDYYLDILPKIHSTSVIIQLCYTFVNSSYIYQIAII